MGMAKARRRGSVKLLGVTRRPRPALLVSTALCATVAVVVSLPALAQPAPNALPTGGKVFGGSASISTSGNTTTINQASQRAAINWQTFNIGSQAQVQFNQPNSAALALNRVTTPNPSQIAGRLNANGQVIIENQSGVIFYKGSQVNTAGLMVSAASSSDAATRAFLNGGKLVTDLPANPNAAVINQGQITVRQAGLAALVAPQVRNDGVIVARLGRVVLASGTQTTLDLYGDGLMSIDVTGLVKTLPNGATALVTNTGVIIADGGTVQLTAREADSIVQTLVDAGGKIRANTIGSHVGKITLAGVGGNITIEGQLQANGAAPGTVGGNIVVNPSGNVNVASTARISASGQAGGGVVAIGTTLKRAVGGPSVTAKHTSAGVTIASGAQIAANATQKGNGGRVTVLSTGTTVINGTISATGGPLGGNGGFVETSGDVLGMATGSVDVAAQAGSAGTWLIDPTNLYIVSGSSADQDTYFNSGGGTITTNGSETTNDQLSVNVLDNASGNVLLQAAQTIEVMSSFSIPAGSLTMEAGKLIQIDRNATAAARDDIILAAGGAGPGTPPAPVGNSVIGIDGSLISSTGNISLLDGPGGDGIAVGTFGLVQAATGKTVTMQTDNILVSGSVVARSGTIEIAPATSASAIDFAGTQAGTLQIPLTSLANMSASVLRLGAVTLNGTLTTTAGSINFDTSVNLGGVADTLDLHATGDVARSADTFALSVGTLTGSIGGNLLLAGGVTTGNTISTIGSFSVGPGDEFQVLTTGGVTIAGPVNAGDFYAADVSGANINVTGSVSATNSAILSDIGGTINISGAIITPNLTIGTYGTVTMTGSAPTIGAAGGTLALGAAGGIFEAGTGTILAGTIIPVAGIGIGTVSLLGSGNTVSNLGSLNASGNFLLATKSALTVADTLAATGSIYLQSSSAGGITIASTGSVLPGSGKLASFQADAFANTGTVIATGGTVEIAPNTTRATVTLGTEGSFASLSGITASLVRIGAITGPGGGTLTTTAGSIVVGGAFGSSNIALELDSTGAIDGTGGALTASTLTGSAGGSATFGNSNTIATLGSFAVGPGGTFALVNIGSLAVTGSVGGVAAAGATITSGAIGINNGSIVVANTGTIGLTSTSGAIALTGTALLNGGTVALSSNTSIAEAASARIDASSLGASADAGAITLLGSANAMTTVTGLVASGGGVTLMVDPSTTLTGLYSGTDLLFDVAGGGTLQIGGGEAGTGATLTATSDTNPTISLIADAITEGSSTSTISAGTSGTLEIAPFTRGTAVALGGTSGAGTLGIDTTLLGDITSTNLLRVGQATGTVTAGSITLASSLNTGTIALELDTTGSIVEAGTIALTTPALTGSAGAGVSLLGTGNAIGTLAAFTAGGNFQLLDNAPTLAIAGLVQSGGNIFIKQAPSQELSLLATGSVIATSNGTIGLVSDQFAFASGASIAAGNGVVELAPVTAGGTLSLGGAGLALGGTLISASLLRVGAYHDQINGGISITAGSIDIAGGLTLGVGTLELDSNGPVSESAGTLSVAALTGTVTGGGVTLGNPANAIGTLDGFAVTGGNFTLASTGSLAVAGPVGADNISLDAGSIGITGLVNAGTVLALGAGNGGVIEASTATISAATLTSIGTIAGGLTLAGTANLIGTLGAISAPGLFRLVDHESLAIAGTVSTGTTGTFDLTDLAGGVSAVAGAGVTTGTLTSSGGIAGSLLLASGFNEIGTISGVTASGTLAILNQQSLTLGGIVSAGTTGTIDLGTANAGSNITQDVSSTLIAGVLTSSSGVTGNAIFQGTGNQIGTISNLGASGTLLVVDTGPLTLAGLVSAGASGTIDLTTTGAGSNITQATSGELLAGLLTSSGGIAGSASFIGSANQIGTLGAMAVSGGDLQLVDSVPLSVAGAVSARDIFLKDTGNGGTITLASGGTLTATNGSAPFIYLVADNLVASGAGTIGAIGGTVALSPFDSGTTVSLAGSLSSAGTMLISGSLLADINTGGGTLQIGSYSDVLDGGGTTITAGAISVDGLLNLGAVAATLRLDTTGAITETGANAISVGTLTGNAGSAVTLANTNTIGTLGSFAAASLILNDATALTIAGPVNAGTGGTIIDTQGLTVTGSLLANAIDLSGSTIAINSTGYVSAASGTIDLLSSGGTIYDVGTLIANTLNGSAQAAASFLGSTTILAVGSFTANGFVLNDSTALSIGSVTGGTLVSIAATGSLTVNNLVSAAVVDLAGTSIGIPGEVTAGTTGTVNLAANAGGITETGSLTTGTLIAGTLYGTATAGASFTGSNTILNVGSFGANGFVLNDGAATLGIGTVSGGTLAAITVAGALTVGTLVSATTIDLSATNITIPGEVNATTGGTVDLTASTGTISEPGMLAAGTLYGSANGAATLTGTNTILNVGSFNANGFVLNDGTALTIGSVTGGTSASIDAAGTLTVNTIVAATTIDLTATSIRIPGLVNAGTTGPVSLIATTGSISDTGTLIAGTLTGSAAAGANLAGFVNSTTFANQVGTLGNFNVGAPDSFVLNSDTALTVAGTVSGGSSVAIDSSQSLGITGSVISTNLISLTGSAIGITGYVSDGGSGTTDLVATSGSILENGTMIVGTLNGTATASASFSGNNTIASVGSFGANGFVLNDGTTALNIGTVIGGTLASVDVTGSLTIGALVSASAIDLTATNMLIKGTVNATPAGAIDLIANGGSISEAGGLIAATLSGSANGAVTLTGTNQIGTVVSFVSNGFALNDGVNLTLDTVTASSFATVLDAGTLTVNGIVSATTISLTAGSITIPGEANAGLGGTIDLAGTNGAITEAGTLIAGTLSGTATAMADFTGTNQILNIGSFGSTGFVLNDGTALTAGVVNGNTSASIDVAGTLTVTTLVSANVINLTATTIVVPGTVTAGTTGTVDLFANPGSITETGLLMAGTLTGSSTGTTDLANAMIGTLNSFSASAFTLNDGTGLTVAAPVIATSGSVTIADTGSLTNNSTIQAATAATVSATQNLTNDGSVYANGGNVLLTASNGTLTNASLIQASASTTLTATSLTNTGSILANGGNALLAASGGALTNGDLIQATANTTLTAATSLTNTGSVLANGGNALLTANSGAMTNGGLVQANTNATLTAGTGITNTGSVLANGGNALLTANAGATTNGGLVQASTNATLTAGTAITNTGSVIATNGNALLAANNGTLSSSGLIHAGANTTLQSSAGMTLGGVVNTAGSTTLNSGGAIFQNGSLISAVLTGSAASVVSLLGATASANQVATLASFSASGFTMNDGEALAVNGPLISAPGVSITDAAALSVNGSIVSATAVNLTGSSVTIGGYVTDGGSGATSLTATAGAITETGTLIAGTLSGSATGAAALTGASAASNQIANIANFSATSVTLQDGASLTATGPVTATVGSIAVATLGALTNHAAIQAATSATLTAGTAVTNTGSIIAQNGNASITASGGLLSNNGMILASANTTLTGSAGISNSNTGSIIAQAGNASLTASTGTLLNSGAMSAGGILSLTALNGPIVQSGQSASMVAGTEVITNASGGISLDGLVKDDTGVVLNSGGNVTQDGILIADLLTGSAAGTVNLLGTGNQVTALGSFTANGGMFALNDGISLAIAGPVTVNGAGGSFTLNDAANVTIAGAVSVTGAGSSFALKNTGSVTINNIITAATLQITTPGTIFLGTGGFVTGGVPNGTPAPITSLGTNALPFIGTAPYMGVTQGAWLKASSVIQTSNVFTVANFNGTAESVLLIELPPDNPASTLHFTDGLQAPTTWAIFDVGAGQSNGTFNVQRLDFLYTQPPGAASFVNSTVGGTTGNAAAGAAFIQPLPNANFRIDGCPIHSVNCAILTTLALPTANPVSDIVVGTPANSGNQEDLVLPVVSDERYELLPCATPNTQGACDQSPPSGG